MIRSVRVVEVFHMARITRVLFMWREVHEPSRGWSCENFRQFVIGSVRQGSVIWKALKKMQCDYIQDHAVHVWYIRTNKPEVLLKKGIPLCQHHLQLVPNVDNLSSLPKTALHVLPLTNRCPASSSYSCQLNKVDHTGWFPNMLTPRAVSGERKIRSHNRAQHDWIVT